MRSLPTPSATGLATALPSDIACSRALAAAIAATTQPPHPDAALIALGVRWRQAQQDWRDIETISKGQPSPTGTRDQIGNAIGAREREIRRAAAAIPAQGLAGLVVKARILATEAECYAVEAITDAEIMAWAEQTAATGCATEQAAASLIADILRLAQEEGR